MWQGCPTTPALLLAVWQLHMSDQNLEQVCTSGHDPCQGHVLTDQPLQLAGSKHEGGKYRPVSEQR